MITFEGRPLASGMPALLLYAANQSYKTHKDVPRRYWLRAADWAMLCDDATFDMVSALSSSHPRIYGIPIVNDYCGRCSMIEHADCRLEEL